MCIGEVKSKIGDGKSKIGDGTYSLQQILPPQILQIYAVWVSIGDMIMENKSNIHDLL